MSHTIQRKRTETGPRFEIEGPGGTRHDAKHPGENLALVEAQRLATNAAVPVTYLVVDEDKVLFTVTRGPDKVVTTARGAS